MATGGELSPGKEKKKGIPRAVTPAYLERAALAYLEKYASSSENLRRVLQRKAANRCRLRGEEATSFDDEIDAVIAKAQRLSLLDDARYAQARVATLRRRGNSGRSIQAKLAAKGLGRDVVEKALCEEDASEDQAARSLVRRRKIGPYRKVNRSEFRQKDIAALARVGFSYDVARAAIDEDIDGDG